MKYLTQYSPKQRLLILLVALGTANLLVWGAKWVAGFPAGALYSTGTVYTADGTRVKFSGKLEFKGNHFNLWTRAHWNGKSNSMYEVGSVTHGALGEFNVQLESASSFGPPVLAEVELDDELAFSRVSMQGGLDKMSMLPLVGDFNELCYYLLYRKRVYCGGQQNAPLARN